MSWFRERWNKDKVKEKEQQKYLHMKAQQICKKKCKFKN